MWLKQSTARTIAFGPFVDAADGFTAENSLTISQADIRLSKNGGAFAQTNNSAGATFMENGHYSIPLDTTDTNTLGHLRVSVNEGGARPVTKDFMVLPANVFDAVAGSDPSPWGVLQSTTITGLSSQTVFNLTAGSADNDAYTGQYAVVVDAATPTQKSVVAITDYVGSTKTLTLAVAPKFTVADGDTIHILASPLTEATVELTAEALTAIADEVAGEATIAAGMASAVAAETAAESVDTKLTTQRAANLDNLDAPVSEASGLVLSTVVSNPGTLTSIELGGGDGPDDIYNGMMIVFYDASNGDAPSRRYVTDWDYVNVVVAINAAPDFLIDGGDKVKIFATPQQLEAVLTTNTRTLLALPAAAPAAGGGLATVNASNYIAGVQGNYNQLDDIVGTIVVGAFPSDVATEDVPASRTFVLVPTSEGLVGETPKTITVGSPGNTYAIDFRNDASVNQKIFTVDSLAITSGPGGGLTFGSTERHGAKAQVRITGVTPGTYKVRCTITYKDGPTSRGDIEITVVA